MTADPLRALVDKWRTLAASSEINALEADSVGLHENARISEKRTAVMLECADELSAALSQAGVVGERTDSVTGIGDVALLRTLCEDVPDMHPTVREQLLRVADRIERGDKLGTLRCHRCGEHADVSIHSYTLPTAPINPPEVDSRLIAPNGFVLVPRELAEAVLSRDGGTACRCIGINRASEREYEAGTCPHQRLAAMLAAAPAAQGADGLDFEPDEQHTVADMANVGYSLMQAISRNRPDYAWNESPAEIVCDLINEVDEARSARVPDGWVLVPRQLTAAMIDAADMRDDDEPASDWGKVRSASRQSIWAAMLAAAPAALCGDCPPVDYPTDSTRCKPCPRRAAPAAPAGGDALRLLVKEMREALEGVVRVADRQTEEFDRARAAITRADRVFVNAGDSESQFISDGRDLNCPACGGSGHVDDATPVVVVDEAMVERAGAAYAAAHGVSWDDDSMRAALAAALGQEVGRG